MFLVRAEIFCAGVRQIIANRAGSAKIIDNRVLHFFIAQSVNNKKKKHTIAYDQSTNVIIACACLCGTCMCVELERNFFCAGVRQIM